MKDLFSKETAKAFRRGSEKLRFDIKRVVDEGQITTVKKKKNHEATKTSKSGRLRQNEWPKPAVLGTSAL